MTMISLGIFGEQRLACEGLKALFSAKDDVQVDFICCEKSGLTTSIKKHDINVMIMILNDFTTPVLNLVSQVGISFPRAKILVLSVHNSEDLVIKFIRAGAKGFLSKESTREELFEAVYTLRNGHDYYNKTITNILLNKYINKIKTDDDSDLPVLDTLSPRQIEILKLWGKSYSNQEIADTLFISIRTVESHKNHIMQKLNLKTTVDMVKFAIKNNLIEI